LINIDPTASISHLADIEDSTKGTLISIGPHSVVDSFVKIKPAGGQGDLIIGKSSYINSGCVLYTGNGITIGNQVLIAANCTFAPVNHEFRDKNIPIISQGFSPSKGGIVVEDDVWIGANVVILDGAVIRKGSVVAANSTVRGETQEYCVYAGNPIRKISERN
jgi:acetyltransferase-like isoleucine patch superfamily enzyme